MDLGHTGRPHRRHLTRTSEDPGHDDRLHRSGGARLLEALERDIGQLEPEVIYLFYRLMAKLQAVRAINLECGRKQVIATIEEVETIMHHLRTAFEGAAGGMLLPWQPGLTPRAGEPRRRVRQETT